MRAKFSLKQVWLIGAGLGVLLTTGLLILKFTTSDSRPPDLSANTAIQPTSMDTLPIPSGNSVQPESASAPDLTLAVNGVGEAEVFQGWPIMVEVSLLHPDAMKQKPVGLPVVLAAKSGPWSNAIRLVAKKTSGVEKAWPFHLALVAPETLSLDAENLGELAWWLAPEDTSKLAEGVYELVPCLIPPTLWRQMAGKERRRVGPFRFELAVSPRLLALRWNRKNSTSSPRTSSYAVTRSSWRRSTSCCKNSPMTSLDWNSKVICWPRKARLRKRSTLTAGPLMPFSRSIRRKVSHLTRYSRSRENNSISSLVKVRQSNWMRLFPLNRIYPHWQSILSGLKRPSGNENDLPSQHHLRSSTLPGNFLPMQQQNLSSALDCHRYQWNRALQLQDRNSQIGSQ